MKSKTIEKIHPYYISINNQKLNAISIILGSLFIAILAQISFLPQKKYEITSTVSLAGCNAKLAESIAKCGPFGSGQPEPNLLLTHISVKQVKWIGPSKTHFTAFLDDGTSKPIKAIMFNAANTAIGNILKNIDRMGPLKVLGKLKKDEWRGGGSVQFIIEDIAEQFN